DKLGVGRFDVRIVAVSPRGLTGITLGGPSRHEAGSRCSAVGRRTTIREVGFSDGYLGRFLRVTGVLQRIVGCSRNSISQEFALPRGTPQIEVTFEVDANSILNVTAEDKASSKSEKITITNDKGHLSQEEIDHMVREAEEFAEEDKNVKERIDARNSLETQIGARQEVQGRGRTKGALEWLDDYQNAEKEDCVEKLKEVEAVCNPIITAVYQRTGGALAGDTTTDDGDDGHDEL
ncbi:heat shock protein 70, partial [Striga asiatica]